MRETIGNPDNGRDDEYWDLEQMEKRHRIITLGIGMEKAARSGKPDALEAFLEELKYEPISEDVKNVFSSAAKEYQKESRVLADTVEREGLCSGDRDADGKKFFELRTGTAPIGVVSSEFSEAFLIVHCSDPRDFVKAAGLYSTYDFNQAGALFHDQILMRKGEFTISVLLVNQAPGRVGGLVDHEWQHWINTRALSAFGLTEGPLPKFLNEDDPHYDGRIDEIAEKGTARRIKDELLAFIRQGWSGRDIVRELASPTYGQLFLVDDWREKHQRILKLIGEALDGPCSLITLPSEPNDKRAMLVYHLFDIEFGDIPAALRAVARFYKTRRDGTAISADSATQERIDTAIFGTNGTYVNTDELRRL